MNTPPTSQADQEPTEAALRLLAFQMRSPSFATGGRIVTPPTGQQMEGITVQEIDEARRYYFEQIQKLGLPLFEPSPL